jgi:DNA-binding GntR family transcriptional regulator
MVIAYEARLALEPGAARLAAANPDPVALERMRTAIARHRRAATQHALFDANRAFHLALVDAARNEHLSRLAANLWAAGIGAVILAVQDETPAEITADADAHERIAAAVAAGDGDRAERLVREHVGGALATFRSTA